MRWKGKRNKLPDPQLRCHSVKHSQPRSHPNRSLEIVYSISCYEDNNKRVIKVTNNKNKSKLNKVKQN